ncbi:Protein of unknown function [Pyronema omphalodes CBS 100304]|uniref:Uncharacterized protein n=1 Tax=Pyronema omphalodes (strain CBS 100304) TaxID=1076935 RepID=U4L1M6_PYROM|nr:Protein of unknown function [Pyronema omphalodes CBS 100304]
MTPACVSSLLFGRPLQETHYAACRFLLWLIYPEYVLSSDQLGMHAVQGMCLGSWRICGLPGPSGSMSSTRQTMFVLLRRWSKFHHSSYSPISLLRSRLCHPNPTTTRCLYFFWRRYVCPRSDSGGRRT